MYEHFEGLFVDKETNIFISYKWNDISREEVDKICKILVFYQINPVRDIYKLKYGNSIKEYMNRISECDGAILLICDEYFFSINCMYEGILAMKNRKNRTLIRMVESSVFSNDFKRKIAEFWDNYEVAGMLGDDKEKLKIVRENYQNFVFWISDINSVSPKDTVQFEIQLKKHIERVMIESFNYLNMIGDLNSSKYIVISKVCDPACEDYYYYKNIGYSIQDSPVDYFKCFYNFDLLLEKCNTKEPINIHINNVVGIEEGNRGVDFAKYYFVIPTQKSLDKLAFEEKFGIERSEIEYDKRRIIVNYLE